MTEISVLLDKLIDKRERKLECASEIVTADEYDDPPMSVVIDAALENLIEHERNLDTLEASWIQKRSSDSTPRLSVFAIGPRS
nr:hypothetical protein [Natrarchaeobius halalkaliphilus]